MADRILIPSIEKRLAGFIEVTRRNLSGYPLKAGDGPPPATITISREFGCEGYLAAEKLKELMEKKTGAVWQIMDKALLAEVAKNHQLSEELFQSIGKRNRFIDDVISTFSPNWKTDQDYYRLLCKQITALAEQGNVIIVGRGAALVTQNLANCFHFRLVGSAEFKTRSIMERTGLGRESAEEMITRRQRERDAFVKEFIGHDVCDPLMYHLIFTNDKNGPERIAETVCTYVTVPM